MLEQTRFIRNAWYVAAWDYEVRADQPLARTLLGEAVVLFRDRKGQVVALHDRCCHRAAPLSLGRIEGDNIRCMYHGLAFDASGHCVSVPAQSHIPSNAVINAYRTVEKDHFIWIWMGDRNASPLPQPPDIWWQSSSKWRWKPGYVRYQANIQLIIDNLLDLSHVSFVHLSTLGTSQTVESQPTYKEIEGGLEITRWDIDSEPTPLHLKAGMQGRVDRWLMFRWLIPSIFLLDAGSCPTGTGAPQGRRLNGIQFRNTSIQTPESEYCTHYFWTHARDFRLDDEELGDAIHSQVAVAFEEDRQMIEAQQRCLRSSTDTRFVSIAADAGPNMARDLIARKLNEETMFDFA